MKTIQDVRRDEIHRLNQLMLKAQNDYEQLQNKLFQNKLLNQSSDLINLLEKDTTAAKIQNFFTNRTSELKRLTKELTTKVRPSAPSLFDRLRDVFIIFFRSIGVISPSTQTTKEFAAQNNKDFDDNKNKINQLTGEVTLEADFLRLVELKKLYQKTEATLKEAEAQLLQVSIYPVQNETSASAEEQQYFAQEEEVADAPSTKNVEDSTPFIEPEKQNQEEALTVEIPINPVQDKASPSIKEQQYYAQEEESQTKQKHTVLKSTFISGLQSRNLYRGNNDSDSEDEDEDNIFEAPIPLSTKKETQSPQLLTFNEVEIVKGFAPKMLNSTTLYVRVLEKTINFHPGTSKIISMPISDVENKLGAIPKTEHLKFFTDHLSEITLMLKDRQQTIQAEAQKKADEKKQTSAAVALSLQERNSPDLNINNLFKASPLGSSSSNSPSSGRSSPAASELSTEQMIQSKKQKEETAVKLRAIHLKENGCKFIKLNDQSSLTDIEVMGAFMKEYSGNVIALVGDKLFDVSKNIARTGIVYKAREIIARDVEGHADVINALKTKIDTLIVGDPIEAKEDLNLAIQVMTGKPVGVQESQDVNKKELNENEKALLSPDDIKVIKGALMVCKSPRGPGEKALLDTKLSISMIEEGNKDEIQAQIDPLYTQIDHQLSNPQALHPREQKALTDLRGALSRCFPTTTTVIKTAIHEAPKVAAGDALPSATPSSPPRPNLAALLKQIKKSDSDGQTPTQTPHK